MLFFFFFLLDDFFLAGSIRMKTYERSLLVYDYDHFKCLHAVGRPVKVTPLVFSREFYSQVNLPTAPPREFNPANAWFFTIPNVPEVVDDGSEADTVVAAIQQAAAAADVTVIPFIVDVFLSSLLWI